MPISPKGGYVGDKPTNPNAKPPKTTGSLRSMTSSEALAYATPCHPDYENWVQEAQALRGELELVKLDFRNACDVRHRLEARVEDLKHDLVAGAASYAGTLRTMEECRKKADLRISELEEQVRLRDEAMTEQTKDYAEWMSPEDYVPMRQEIDRLRKIAAHIPGLIYIKAKEAAGFGTPIKPV